MAKTDVLVIGGSAAGLSVAAAGKSSYPEKRFLLVRKELKVMVPCGIPYIFGTLESSDQNVLPADETYNKLGVRYRVGEVESINKRGKYCRLYDGTKIFYQKLVLATGSTPKTPTRLKGIHLHNVFTIPKDKAVLDGIITKLKDVKKVVTIGGGFIGVELSDELNKGGKEVTIVEVMPHILSMAFDEEFSVRAEETLENRGIKIKGGSGVKEILGRNGKVSGVLLNNGERIDADAIIMSMGYEPNTGMAKRAGIEVNENGFIKVDEYMRTNDPDIFAVGDCAEKRDFVTRKPSNIMLASTSCAEARIAGMNLFELSTLKTFSGTIAIFSTSIGGVSFAAAGLTERQAKDEGFNIVTGVFEGPDKHPGKLPDTRMQRIKLIVAKESGVVMGGEAMGSASTGELINVVGLAIQNRMTINSLIIAQIGTHPLLTASPAAYPLIKAAEVAHRQIFDHVRSRKEKMDKSA
jgi:NADPH-dependent 2,4-dienoyl-CoA reductase/sulfur reductase-like enzyme